MILKATSICCDPTPKSLSRREFENMTHFGTLKKIAGVASTVVPLAKPLPGMQKTLSTTSVSRVTSLLLSTLLNSWLGMNLRVWSGSFLQFYLAGNMWMDYIPILVSVLLTILIIVIGYLMLSPSDPAPKSGGIDKLLMIGNWTLNSNCGIKINNFVQLEDIIDFDLMEWWEFIVQPALVSKCFISQMAGTRNCSFRGEAVCHRGCLQNLHYDHPVLHSALILIRSGYLIFINMMMLFKLGDCRQVLSTKSWPSCATKTRN